MVNSIIVDQILNLQQLISHKRTHKANCCKVSDKKLTGNGHVKKHIFNIQHGQPINTYILCGKSLRDSQGKENHLGSHRFLTAIRCSYRGEKTSQTRCAAKIHQIGKYK